MKLEYEQLKTEKLQNSYNALLITLCFTAFSIRGSTLNIGRYQSKQYPLQIDIYTTHEDKLIISNKIHPKSEDSKGSGIGFKNLWGRYRMLTGKDIQISNRKEYFKVTLPLLNKPIHS